MPTNSIDPKGIRINKLINTIEDGHIKLPDLFS